MSLEQMIDNGVLWSREMTIASPGRQRPRRSRSASQLVAACAVAVLLTACSNTTASNDNSSRATSSSGQEITAASVDQKALAATVKKAFLTDLPVSELDPVVANAMAVASTPLNADQSRLLRTCLQKDVCDTGRGSLTVAFPNDNTNPWRSVFRAELTAQAVASPQIKRFIYNNASDVASFLANFRSLIAQRVDVIVMDSIYASAILPVVKQAKQAGITVVQVQTPITGAVADEVDSVIAPDLCQVYADGAKAVAKEVGSASTYALYTGIAGNSNAAVWQPCAQKALKDAGWTEATKGYTQWTRQGEAEAANALLASGKKVGAIVYDSTPDDFVKPYITEKRTPPVVLSDVSPYSWLRTFKEAQDAGLDPKGFISDSMVWYGRLGVTAGVMIEAGQSVTKKITPPMPVVPVDTVLGLDDPAVPADTPVPSLLTPQEIKLALSVS